MGYGILALQPLGDGYVSHGVVAGLVSAIIVLLAGALLGGSAGLMYTPRSVVTLIMAAVILEGVARGPAAVAAHGDVQRTLTLVFFVVVAAGLFQALFGALRLAASSATSLHRSWPASRTRWPSSSSSLRSTRCSGSAVTSPLARSHRTWPSCSR